MKQIVQFNKQGEELAVYDSLSNIFKVTGIQQSTVKSCLEDRKATAGGFFFVYKRDSVTHNLDDRKIHKMVHLYAARDGINIHTKAFITLDDKLRYRGKLYSIGKADDMPPAVKESESIGCQGCNYYEFTIREV